MNRLWNYDTGRRRNILYASLDGKNLISWNPWHIDIIDVRYSHTRLRWSADGDDITAATLLHNFVLVCDQSRLYTRDIVTGVELGMIGISSHSRSSEVDEIAHHNGHSFAISSADETYSFSLNDVNPNHVLHFNSEYDQQLTQIQFHPSGNNFFAVADPGGYEVLCFGECDKHGINVILDTPMMIGARVLSHGFSNSGNRYAVVSGYSVEIELYVFDFPSMSLIARFPLRRIVTDQSDQVDDVDRPSSSDYSSLASRYPFQTVFLSDERIVVFPDDGGVVAATMRGGTFFLEEIAESPPIRGICINPLTRQLVTVDVLGNIVGWECFLEECKVADVDCRNEWWFRKGLTGRREINFDYIHLVKE